MGGKRPSPVATNIKAAKSPKVDPAVKQCGIVSRSLKEVGLEPSALEMLSGILGLSLATPKDERHPFQVTVVEEVERLLQDHEQTLEERVEEAAAQVSTVDDEIDMRTNSVHAAHGELEAKSEVYTKRKYDLASVAEKYHEAQADHFQASVAQECFEKSRSALMKDIDKLESGVADSLEPLTQGTLKEGLIAHEVATALLNRLKKVEMDEALRQVSVTALSKAPADRGSFENMAVTSLDQAVERTLSNLKAKLSEGDADQQQFTTAASDAARVLDEAKQAQLVAAKSFIAAQEDRKEADSAKTRAEESLRHIEKERKKVVKMLEAAKAKLQTFQLGGWETFVELRDRTAPAEVEEVPEEKEEPAPVVPAEVEEVAEEREEPAPVLPVPEEEELFTEIVIEEVAVDSEPCEELASLKDVPVDLPVANTATAGA